VVKERGMSIADEMQKPSSYGIINEKDHHLNLRLGREEEQWR
jgi:hypothetical protein